jgi:two-component system NtrC family sensor kinase
MPIHPSLRNKITFGYYAIGLIFLTLSVFAYRQLNITEGQVIAGEDVADFFDTALEIRRFEKNYFLYQNEEDLAQTLHYVQNAEQTLARHGADFATLIPASDLTTLRSNLQSYARLLRDFHGLERGGQAARAALELRIRSTGKELLNTAERLAKTERHQLQAFLNQSRHTLLIAILALCALVVVIGQTLARRVVRSLRFLENNMALVAQGHYDALRIDTHERELVSLTEAFNKLLLELELKRKHLLHSEKLASLGTLLSGVAHELNNPLSNISSSCQILLEELDEGDRVYQRALLEQIDQQTLRAQQLIRPLLEYARDKDFTRAFVPLKKLVQDTLQLLTPHLSESVSVSIDIVDDVVIYADRQRIQQVLFNLIKNSAESIDGLGSITLRTHATAAWLPTSFGNAQFITLEIRDTGRGIAPELLPHIFDPFFTTKDVGKGTGLGLYIVHEIITEHGGRISVDSTPGQGTRILIALPTQPPQANTTL